MIHVRSVLIGIVIGAASMACVLFERKALNCLMTTASNSMKALEQVQVTSASNETISIRNTNQSTILSETDHHPPSPQEETQEKDNDNRKVVLVTKIHDVLFFRWLPKALCLLHAGYNKQHLHDIVVFTTIPLEPHEVERLVRIAHPAKLTVSGEWGNKTTIRDHLDVMTPKQQKDLVARCNDVNSTDQLTWRTRCTDGRFTMPLAYNWMSEFRAKYIWREPILQEYRYMIWFDADALLMEAWKEDPIQYMVEKNLVLFMANVPGSRTPASTGVHRRIFKAYNRTVCKATMGSNGYFQVKYGHGSDACAVEVPQVHGFMHITDLDFYRDPVQQRWFDVMIGDGRFQRLWDDQLAVMVPGIMMAPNRTAKMVPVGFNPMVMHHLVVNGAVSGKFRGGFNAYWRDQAEKKFPEAWPTCGRP